LLLGACVLAGRPRLYTRSLPVQALLLAGVQLWREDRVRQSRATRSGDTGSGGDAAQPSSRG
ncbi:hypothetical protein IHN57_19585, partial [Deinococcus sp. 6GRE01]|nr:hypothetical protein [Deinococcus sp. 6GRE01]